MDLSFLVNKYLFNRRIVGGYDYQFQPYAGGAYNEKEFQPIIFQKDDCFLDIGANVGGWSIPASKYYREVYAFEPSPKPFKALKRNLEANNVLNVVPMNMALGDIEESKQLHLYNASGQDSFYHSHLGYWSNGEKAEVRVRRLDSLLLQPSCVKIDTEGYEPEIVKGALGTLEKYHPRIIIETHDTGDPEKIQRMTGFYKWELYARENQTIMIGH